MTNKNIFKRFLNAGLRAYSIPTLPDNILKIQSYPIIRIFRFLGGFSLLMILSKSYLNYHSYFTCIFFIFALIFTIYHFIISFYRFKHMLSVFKSDKFDIRNSPLDASEFTKILNDNKTELIQNNAEIKAKKK
jgi:hypothetical protein